MKKLLAAIFLALLLAGCGEETVVGKWDEWGANPEPYGGLEVLTKIKRAAEGRWERHDNEFGLRDSNITDISPLAGLTKLRRLDLPDNQISDLSPLKRLTKLEELHFYRNEITDISPLKGLTKLRYLSVDGYPISEDQKAMLKKALPNCEIYF